MRVVFSHCPSHRILFCVIFGWPSSMITFRLPSLHLPAFSSSIVGSDTLPSALTDLLFHIGLSALFNALDELFVPTESFVSSTAIHTHERISSSLRHERRDAS
jgi:hypothetical protein